MSTPTSRSEGMAEGMAEGLAEGLLRGSSDPSSASAAEEALGACRKLRSKLAFLPLRTADNEPLYWERGDGSTSVYWCLRTMECGGPDGGLAHGTLCRSGRLCHEPITS